MRYLYTLSLVFICLNLQVFASSVTPGQASLVAENFFKTIKKTNPGLAEQSPVLVETSQDQDYTYFYIFSYSSQPGWVIVSGDNSMSPVIGYSDKDSYLPDQFQQNKEFQFWLEMYREVLRHTTNGDAPPDPGVAGEWLKLQSQDNLVPSVTLSQVLPLLTTLWDQDCNYNMFCPATGPSHPMGPCSHTLTGCVATAMAQIVKYWNFPNAGAPTVFGYTDLDNLDASGNVTDPSYGQISTTYGAPYPWDDMPDVPGSPNNDISQLIFDCGVGVLMNYSATYSGAYTEMVPPFLNVFYNYDASMQYIKMLDLSITWDLWQSILNNELDNGRPVLYDGRNLLALNSGHAWVCDGYNSDSIIGTTYYHMNWGWGGAANGYFQLLNLNPPTFNFSFDNGMIIGIKPNDMDPLPPTNVDAVCANSARVDLSWHWSSNATFYKVYRSYDGDPANAVALTDWIASTNITDYNVQPNTLYWYWVKSAKTITGGGESGMSNGDFAITDNIISLYSGLSYYFQQSGQDDLYGVDVVDDSWTLVAARPYINDDWDVSMYQDYLCVPPVIASSILGNGQVDFVLADGHHMTPGTRGIRFAQYAGDLPVTVAADHSGEVIGSGTSNTYQILGNTVARVFNADLSPGTYYATLHVISGSFNPGFAIFSSSGGQNYLGRNSALAISDDNGQGEDETFVITINESDIFAVVVWSNNLLSGLFNIKFEKLGVWTGALNNNWHNPYNWSFNVVPSAGIDVTIPNVTNKPVISAADAECRSLKLELGSGQFLRISDHTLTINGNADFYGKLRMDNPVATAKCIVMGNVNWKVGSSADMVDPVTMIVYGDWQFDAWSAVNMTGGSVYFYGNESSTITTHNPDCAFNNLGITKTGSNFVYSSALSNESLTIHGYLRVNGSSWFVSNSDSATYIGGNIINNGSHIDFTSGVVVMNGSTQTITCKTGDNFNNLWLNPISSVSLGSDILVKGYLYISNGTFNAVNHDIEIRDDWYENSGFATFIPGTGNVSLSGSKVLQLLSTNTPFNTLTLNKDDGIAYITGSSVSCNTYIWLSGGISVAANGIFTASHLSNNGISGSFSVSTSGTINLHNPGGYVDLNGSLTLNGGQINVYGGTTDSYWPYTSDARLTMTDGILDFKETGILLYNTISHTLQVNITGGLIRTSGNFLGDRYEFTPRGGTVELYQENNCQVTTTNGAHFNNLKINKTNASVPAQLDAMTPELSSNASGPEANPLTNNIVTVNSGLYVHGNMDIQAGKLSAGSNNIYMYGNWNDVSAAPGFDAGSGSVSFSHYTPSLISTSETFYSLYINKTTFSGYGVEVASGKFITVLNEFHCNSGTMKMNDNSRLTSHHLEIANNAGLNADALGVKLYVGGNWTDQNLISAEDRGFYPGTHSTVYFNSSIDQNMNAAANQEIFNALMIDKPSGNFYANSGIHARSSFRTSNGIFNSGPGLLIHTFEGTFSVEAGATWNNGSATVQFSGAANQNINFAPASGALYNVFVDKHSGSTAYLTHDLISMNTGMLKVDSGTIDLSGYLYRCTGDVTLNGQGILSVPAGSILEVGNLHTLNVGLGSELHVYGDDVNPAKITRHSGNYSLNVQYGGMISASKAIFEYMGPSGVNVQNGGVVDPAYQFSGCTFRYGSAGGTLLTLSNSQFLNIPNASFPSVPFGGGHNVTKSVDQGIVNFSDFTGNFSGASYETDPYGRINWGAGGFQLSGMVNYDNVINTSMWGTKVYLCNAAAVLDSATTTSTGGFTFSNLMPGTYFLNGHTSKTWGGVNAADALKIMQHYVFIDTLSDFRQRAADLDMSNYINASDALVDMRRFVGLINGFNTGDWLFDNTVFTLSSNTSRNLKAICFGDVNGSYIPSTRKSAEVNLIPSGILNPGSADFVEIPLQVVSNAEVGSISLVLEVEDAPVELLDVTIPGSGKPAVFHRTGNTIRIAWADPEAVRLKQGETLLLLRFKNQAEALRNLELLAGPESEVTGDKAISLPMFVLTYPKPGTLPSNAVSSAGPCYPNPVNDLLNIPLVLAASSTVNLTLTDLAGRILSESSPVKLDSGNQLVQMTMQNISPGTYFLNTEIEHEGNVIRKIERIVVTR